MPNYRHATYAAGALAYVDSFAGMIPCRVLMVSDDAGTVSVKVTATRGDYRRGEVLSLPARGVVPRDKVFTRGGAGMILPTFSWSPVAQ